MEQGLTAGSSATAGGKATSPRQTLPHPVRCNAWLGAVTGRWRNRFPWFEASHAQGYNDDQRAHRQERFQLGRARPDAPTKIRLASSM